MKNNVTSISSAARGGGVTKRSAWGLLVTVAVASSSLPVFAAAENTGPGLLQAAYQQELSFLRAESDTLKARLADEQKKLNRDERSAQQVQAGLRAQVLKMQSAAEAKERAAEKLALATDDKRALREQLASQLSAFAAASSSTEAAPTLAQHFRMATEAALHTLASGRKIQTEPGAFFDALGKEQRGTLTSYGEVATFGEQNGRAFLLAPTGTGALSVYEVTENASAPRLQTLGNGALAAVLFADKGEAIVKKKDVTVRGQLDASGAIGWAIFILGLFGLLLIVVRTLRVTFTARAVSALEHTLGEAGSVGDVTSARSTIERYTLGKLAFGPLLSRQPVGANTKAAPGQAPQNDDALVDEGLLAARGHFEMLSTAILVTAAVAPLMGLLGTVTGMISTFDSITTFGTGDPRILSGGISEALLTTEFGLVVAIPTLLLGNLLSAWGRGLESRTESLMLRTLRVLRGGSDKVNDIATHTSTAQTAEVNNHVVARTVLLPPPAPTTDLPEVAAHAG